MTDQTEKIYLPLYSALGTNAYYLDDCKVVEHRPSYAACLAKFRDHQIKKEGRQGTEACRASMRAGTCKAADMHLEEELAGKALYFVDRNRLSDESLRHSAAMPSPSFVRPGSVKKVDDSKTYASPSNVVVKRAPPIAEAISSVSDGYADAINMAMREALAKPKPEAAVAPPSPKPIAVTAVANVVKAGMSMVEIARAALASKAL